MSIDLAHLRGWIGRTETRSEVITAFPSNALAATLDRDDPPYAPGDPLPSLWHWLHFLPLFALTDAGYDGHQALGGFLPPVPLPRRMWAGSRLRFLAPARISAELVKTATVLSVDHKAGRSGDLVFVSVRHVVSEGGQALIEDEHDIVYRALPDRDAPAQVPPQAPGEDDFARVITPGPVLLFRYSALTFNGHRIHYDRPFCAEEGYEGLVVHGPLLATLMLDVLRRNLPDAALRSFRFRAVAPVVDTGPFSVHGKRDGGTVRLWVRRGDGALAMDGSAELG
ncbi:MAG: MaoC family dehydratase N-terminal domain-containing protein [Pararhodobacter sp.]|nr:MaoC family dehydratase N-terminal domain-containing protein [Pararhodobacter sp.]